MKCVYIHKDYPDKTTGTGFRHFESKEELRDFLNSEQGTKTVKTETPTNIFLKDKELIGMAKVDAEGNLNIQARRYGSEFGDKSRGGTWYEVPAYEGQRSGYEAGWWGSREANLGVGGKELFEKEITLKNPYFVDWGGYGEGKIIIKIANDVLGKDITAKLKKGITGYKAEKSFAKLENAISNELSKRGYDGIVIIDQTGKMTHPKQTFVFNKELSKSPEVVKTENVQKGEPDNPFYKEIQRIISDEPISKKEYMVSDLIAKEKNIDNLKSVLGDKYIQQRQLDKDVNSRINYLQRHEGEIMQGDQIRFTFAGGERTGEIVSVKGNEFEVKGDNGRSYTVKKSDILGEGETPLTKEEQAKDQILKGIEGLVDKMKGRTTLLPEDRTTIIQDLKNIAEGLTDLTVEKIKQIIKEALALYKDKFGLTDKDIKDITNEIVKEREKKFENLFDDIGENVSSMPIGNTIKAKKNYSNWSAFQNYFGYNLHQLRKFDPELADKVVSYANTMAQTAVIMKKAARLIVKKVGVKGWQELRSALVESRLRGCRDRWNEMSQSILDMPDEDFLDNYDQRLKKILPLIEPKLGEKGILQTVNKFIENEDYQGAKSYLSDLFKICANNVSSVDFSGGRSFDEITNDPKIQDALNIYKDHIEKPIAENHAQNEGIFSDALGDLNTYYPLISLDGKGGFLKRAKAFKKPINVSNFFATGMSENYSTSFESLSNKLYRAFKANNKADIIKTLENSGLLIRTKGEPSDFMIVNGELYKAHTEDITDQTKIIKDGKTTFIPIGKVTMPDWLYNELKPVLDKNAEYDKPTVLGKVLGKITSWSLGGPFEMVFHSANLIGGLTNATPFAGTSLLSKTIGNLPVTKIFASMLNTAFEDVSSGDVISHIQNMADVGLLPTKSMSMTWSKKRAETYGLKYTPFFSKQNPFGNFAPVLYGTHGIDLKARVLMDRIALNINPDATPQQRREFGYQLGNYTHELQGKIEQSVKRSGLSPFYTAGSTFYKNGLKALIGMNPLPTKGLSPQAKIGYKTAQLMSSGIIGMVGTWFVSYKATTGKWPWEDKDSKLMQIPLPEEIKNTEIGKKLFYDKDKKKWNNVSLDFFNPVLSRGIRATGANNAYKIMKAGGTVGEIVEAANIQEINSALSPFVSSPPLKLAGTMLTGSSPYIVSLRGENGGPGIQFFKNVKTMPSGLQIPANIAQGLINVNPLLERISEHTGFGFAPKYESDLESYTLINQTRDVAFPRLFKPNTPMESTRKWLLRERGEIKSSIKKQDKVKQSKQTPSNLEIQPIRKEKFEKQPFK